MFGMKEGQRFVIKTGFKSKFKDRIFFVKKVTERGTLLINVEGVSGYFYITEKRSQDWFHKHILLVGKTYNNNFIQENE